MLGTTTVGLVGPICYNVVRLHPTKIIDHIIIRGRQANCCFLYCVWMNHTWPGRLVKVLAYNMSSALMFYVHRWELGINNSRPSRPNLLQCSAVIIDAQKLYLNIYFIRCYILQRLFNIYTCIMILQCMDH